MYWLEIEKVLGIRFVNRYGNSNYVLKCEEE